MQEREKITEQNSAVGVTQSRKPLRQDAVTSSQGPGIGMAARQETPIRPRVSPEKTRKEVPIQQPPNTAKPRAKGQQSHRPTETASRAATQQRPAEPRANARQDINKKPVYSPFVPLLVMALTMLVMVTFQTIQISKDREVLTTVKTNQEAAVIESQKVRLQFESIAENTGQLAANGNKNAQAIMEQLRKQGITVNLNAASAQ